MTLSVSHRWHAWLIALLCVIALFQLVTITPGHGWGDDFAGYIAHARNLVEGRPYAETGYVYNKDEPIGPPAYPPGLPLLLAPIYALRGLDYSAMKALMVLSLVVGLLFVASLVKRWDSPESALAVVALIGFNPFFWDFKNEVLSDLPFFCFFFLSMWLMQRALTAQMSTSDAILLAIAWWAAYATRTLGLVLPAAFVATELYTRRWQRSTFVALAVFAVFCILQAIALQSPASYMDQLSLNSPRVAGEIVVRSTAFMPLFDAGLNSAATAVTFVAASFFAVVGLIQSWSKRCFLPVIVFAFYIAAVAASMVVSRWLWMHDQGFRYLIPAVPHYLFFVVFGMKTVANRMGKAGYTLELGAAVAVIGMYIAGYSAVTRTPLPPRVESQSAQSLFTFFRRSTPRDAVVIFKAPRALALYTNRKAAIYTRTIPADPWDFIRKIHATYIASIKLSAQDSAFVNKVERERPNSVKQVFVNDQFTVYELSRQQLLTESIEHSSR
ncbi:MAG: glycosyltransferase family 39 protein [Gemmatimonadaceae bacterium]